MAKKSEKGQKKEHGSNVFIKSGCLERSLSFPVSLPVAISPVISLLPLILKFSFTYCVL